MRMVGVEERGLGWSLGRGRLRLGGRRSLGRTRLPLLLCRGLGGLRTGCDGEEFGEGKG